MLSANLCRRFEPGPHCEKMCSTSPLEKGCVINNNTLSWKEQVVLVLVGHLNLHGSSGNCSFLCHNDMLQYFAPAPPRPAPHKGPDSATSSNSGSRESVLDGDAILLVAKKKKERSVAHQQMVAVRDTLQHSTVAQEGTAQSSSSVDKMESPHCA